MLYVCVVLILKDKEASEEFKTLAFASGMLAVLMPIDRMWVSHICAMKLFCTAIYCNLYRRQNEKGEETD